MQKTFIILYRQFIQTVTLCDGALDFEATNTASNMLCVVPVSYDNMQQLADQVKELMKKHNAGCWSRTRDCKTRRFFNPSTI